MAHGQQSEKAERLLDLAAKRFPDLTEPEKKFFEHVAEGSPADFSSENDDNDPGRTETWGTDRVLQADRISWVCTDREALALVTHRGIHIQGARIQGMLDLRDARMSFPLAIVNCAFPDGMDFRDGHVTRLVLTGTHSGLIHATGLRVDGSVFMDKGFNANPGVVLVGATIGHDLGCRGGGSFENENGVAFNAQGFQVNGSVVMDEGFTAKGEVILTGATIGGVLDCRGGTFDNKGGGALLVDGIQVDGDVFMNEGFNAKGRVSLVSATINGHFVWTGVHKPENIVLDLRSSKIHILWDEEASWPNPGNLHLNGLVYDQFFDEPPMDIKTRLEWLRLQRDDRYMPQPFEQLASVLERSGHDVRARFIQIAKAKARGRVSEMRWYEGIWHQILGLTVGYGHRLVGHSRIWNWT